MFLWIFLNSCPLNLLLIWSRLAQIIIVKRLIQGRDNVTRVRVAPKSFYQGRSTKVKTKAIITVQFSLSVFPRWLQQQQYDIERERERDFFIYQVTRKAKKKKKNWHSAKPYFSRS